MGPVFTVTCQHPSLQRNSQASLPCNCGLRSSITGLHSHKLPYRPAYPLFSQHNRAHKLQRHTMHKEPRAHAGPPDTAPASQKAKYPQTWSNPTGQVLTQVAENIWAGERAFMWNKIDVGGRMAVIRFKSGALWVQSPIELDDDLKRALAEIGDVKYVVSPNYEHVKFAPQWIEAYPEAKSYACPGLAEQKPDIRFTGTVGFNNEVPAEWAGEVSATHLDFEHNPFNGKPFFNEVVFLHEPSGMLVTTDLFWNYPGGDDVPFGTRLWKFGMNRVYLPFYRSFMIKDKGAYQAAMKRIFEEWQWDSLLPCHGSYIPQGAKALMAHHLHYKL